MASDSDTTPPQSDDLSVIAGIAAGDKQALAQLYDRYASDLAGVGMKILKDKAQVETLLHEVFVQVWQNAGSYDPSCGSVKTWLCLQMCNRGLQLSGLESTAGVSA